eukprot:2334742-Prymnesium_polylepis.3
MEARRAASVALSRCRAAETTAVMAADAVLAATRLITASLLALTAAAARSAASVSLLRRKQLSISLRLALRNADISIAWRACAACKAARILSVSRTPVHVSAAAIAGSSRVMCCSSTFASGTSATEAAFAVARSTAQIWQVQGPSSLAGGQLSRTVNGFLCFVFMRLWLLALSRTMPVGACNKCGCRHRPRCGRRRGSTKLAVVWLR